MPTKLPKCQNARCGRRKTVRQRSDGQYVCSHCGCIWDAEPDEGGDYCDRNPAARLEREERQRERKLDRIGRR